MPSRSIVVLSSCYPAHENDAAGHFVRSEARALARSGHAVTVVTAGPSACADPDVHLIALSGGGAFGWPGVLPRLRERPSRAWALSSWCVRAARVLRALEPDELVAHFLLPSLFPLAEAVRCPVTAVAHGSDVALFAQLPRALRYALTRRCVGRVRFRFVSERLRSEFARAAGPHWRALDGQSIVAPCVIDTHGTPSRAKARAQLGLDDRFLALMSTRMVPGKRVDWALRHAPLPSGARWVVLGDGPERSRLARTFPEVEFKGHVDRPTALLWLSAADVLVACSEREGAPSAIREARALGTTVWTNDVGDVRGWAEKDPGIHVLRELEPGLTANNGTGHGRSQQAS